MITSKYNKETYISPNSVAMLTLLERLGMIDSVL